MVFRVLLVAALALTLMFVIKDGRVTAKIGLVSHCDTIATPAGQRGQWRECKKGLIDGRRSLKDNGCEHMQTHGDYDVWRCTED